MWEEVVKIAKEFALHTGSSVSKCLSFTLVCHDSMSNRTWFFFLIKSYLMDFF